MIDLTNDIGKFWNIRKVLEDDILKCVTEFVAQNGREEDGEVFFDLNSYDLSESIDMPQAKVEVDSATGDCNWERIQTLSIRKAGKGLVRLQYTTESFTDSFVFLDTDSMTDIYFLLYTYSQGQLDDIYIKDGKFEVKE